MTDPQKEPTPPVTPKSQPNPDVDQLAAIHKELVEVKLELIKSRKQLTRQVASGVALATIVISIIFGLFGFLFTEIEQANRANLARQRTEELNTAAEKEMEETMAASRRAAHDFCVEYPSSCKQKSSQVSPKVFATPSLISPTNAPL